MTAVPNFSRLLTLGDIKPPPPPPTLDYPGVITKFEKGANKNSTPYIRFWANITGWPENYDDEEVMSRVNIAGRSLRYDFWDTDSARHHVVKFLGECGVPASTPYGDEAFALAVGAPVLILTSHYMKKPRHVSQEPETLLQASGLIGLAQTGA